MMDDFRNDLERAQYLQSMLIDVATGGTGEDTEFKILRRYFLDDLETKEILPSFVRTNRELSQFWQYIKNKFAHYSERREYIWSEFNQLLDSL